ncbi:MAG: SsrA-binding protein SmpB [Phycisphaerales bacterium]
MAKNKKKQKDLEPEILNRKARHNYHIDDTIEVGIKLLGTEIKSIREGRISLAEGYVRAQEQPPLLEVHGIHIGEYGPAGAGSLQHTPIRTRKLLAHKREILKLAKASAAKGMTIVPLKVYFKNGFAKMLIGVARGKATYDKREDIKEREAKRDIDRALSKKIR